MRSLHDSTPARCGRGPYRKSSRVCGHCGEGFMAADAAFCGAKCRDRARNGKAPPGEGPRVCGQCGEGLTGRNSQRRLLRCHLPGPCPERQGPGSEADVTAPTEARAHLAPRPVRPLREGIQVPGDGGLNASAPRHAWAWPRSSPGRSVCRSTMRESAWSVARLSRAARGTPSTVHNHVVPGIGRRSTIRPASSGASSAALTSMSGRPRTRGDTVPSHAPTGWARGRDGPGSMPLTSSPSAWPS